jgi:hypothetical protein
MPADKPPLERTPTAVYFLPAERRACAAAAAQRHYVICPGLLWEINEKFSRENRVRIVA